jgi:hypothetical protein
MRLVSPGGVEQRVDELLRVYQSLATPTDPLFKEMETHGAFRGMSEHSESHSMSRSCLPSASEKGDVRVLIVVTASVVNMLRRASIARRSNKIEGVVMSKVHPKHDGTGNRSSHNIRIMPPDMRSADDDDEDDAVRPLTRSEILAQHARPKV